MDNHHKLRVCVPRAHQSERASHFAFAIYHVATRTSLITHTRAALLTSRILHLPFRNPHRVTREETAYNSFLLHNMSKMMTPNITYPGIQHIYGKLVNNNNNINKKLFTVLTCTSRLSHIHKLFTKCPQDDTHLLPKLINGPQALIVNTVIYWYFTQSRWAKRVKNWVSSNGAVSGQNCPCKFRC